MCFLSFISFLLLPTPLDSITWQVSPGWEQEGLESWTLDAPSAGIYTVSGCTVEPFEELTLDMSGGRTYMAQTTTLGFLSVIPSCLIRLANLLTMLLCCQ